ncbi:MAG: hypothetical protein CMJ31_08435 [Phycisphaerae bacterium]|nr:hypothetical protein [Phycisphaerae bacterium]
MTDARSVDRIASGMFVIRRAKVDDSDTLLKLARMVHFINLPPDKEIIVQKVIHSRNSFLKVANQSARPEPEPTPKVLSGLGQGHSSMAGLGAATAKSPLFLFVMEDTASGGALGASQVVSHMGGPGAPNASFKLEKREFFSADLQTGTTQMVAKMHLDESGPSEIGGLILQPSYRGHKKKLGRFLSFVRFHFIGLHRELFAEKVLAEMMAPITSDGDNLLWDYLGRRFVPLSYDEADRFCQYSREFITSLLPKEDIYLSLLPPAARAVVGEVGVETRPARRMLEKLGFAYKGFVDPFDGGPHLECATDEISLVKDTSLRDLGKPVDESECDRVGILSYQQSDGDFFAVCEPFTIGRAGVVHTTEHVMTAINASAGDTIGLTPTDGQSEAAKRPAAKKRAASRKPALSKKAAAAPKPLKKPLKKQASKKATTKKKRVTK